MSDLSHSRRVSLLVLLAIAVQAWMLHRNTVPAQDAVAYLRIARQFAHQPLLETLRRNVQHPLFPLLISCFHESLARSFGEDGAGWVLAAQSVAAAASVLLVVPMYFAGLRLGNPFTAVGGTIVFTLIPAAARLGADALSESSYLLFFLVGLWASLEFLSARRPLWLLLGGASAGFAFLARVEGLALPVALVLTLAMVQIRPTWRIAWRTATLGVACLIAATLAVAGPYMLAIGKLTPRSSLGMVFGSTARPFWGAPRGSARPPLLSDGEEMPSASGRVPLPDLPDARLDFSLKRRPTDEQIHGYAAAAQTVARRLIEGMNYVVALLALVGLYRSPRQPANLFAATLVVVFAAALVKFAAGAGYVSGRHVITLICLGSFSAARGSAMLAEMIVGFWLRSTQAACGNNAERLALRERRRFGLAGTMLAVASLPIVPHAFAPLHASREAHVRAGRWLAEHASASPIVLDTRGWAALYSGARSYAYDHARKAFEDPRLEYLIVENAELLDPRPRGETLRWLMSLAGEPVAEFPMPVARDGVQVYRWHPERLFAAGTSPRSSPDAEAASHVGRAAKPAAN